MAYEWCLEVPSRRPRSPCAPRRPESTAESFESWSLRWWSTHANTHLPPPPGLLVMEDRALINICFRCS